MIRNLKHSFRQQDRRLVGIGLSVVIFAALDFSYRVLPDGPLGGGYKPTIEMKALSVPRPPASWTALYAEEDVIAPSKDVPTIDETAQVGELTTLVMDKQVFALRACFLETSKGAAAAVSALEQGADDGLKILKLGDNFGPYLVTAIRQSSLTLKTATGREVNLRLFPQQATYP